MESSGRDNPTRLENIVETYITSAENYNYSNLLDSARIQLDKAKAILSPKPRSNLYLPYYFAEGTYYDRSKQYKNAISSLDSGIALARDPASRFHANRLKYAKFKTLSNSNNLSAATQVMQDLLKSPLVFTADKKLYYKELYGTYARLGNLPEAYRWAERYISLSDSMYKEKSQNDIIEMEKKYNDAENQKKISLLQADKEKAVLTSRNNRLLAWLLGGSCLFLLALSVLGALYLGNTKKLARQKAISYQQQLNEVNQQQQLQLAQALLQGEERERKRLAGDLHDGLGGMLAGIKFNLTRIPPNNEVDLFTRNMAVVINMLDKSVNELRRIARNLMPETLLNSGLEAALKDMCELPLSENVKIDFQPFNIEKTIPPEMQVTIYRIVQELLTNAVKHAGTSSVLVQCSQNKHVFYITVEDNGKGFTKETSGNGIGLANVKHRVDYLKGSLEVCSALGEGTTINIEFNVGT